MDVDQIALEVVATIMGAEYQWFTDPERVDLPTAMETYFDQLIALVLVGLDIPPPSAPQGLQGSARCTLIVGSVACNRAKKEDAWSDRGTSSNREATGALTKWPPAASPTLLPFHRTARVVAAMSSSACPSTPATQRRTWRSGVGSFAIW